MLISCHNPYSTVQSALILENSVYFPRSVFKGFVWLSEYTRTYTAIISLNNIDRLDFYKGNAVF
jgi:hypothetical protein